MAFDFGDSVGGEVDNVAGDLGHDGDGLWIGFSIIRTIWPLVT